MEKATHQGLTALIPFGSIGNMFTDPKLSTVSKDDRLSYSREAQEFLPSLIRFVVKNRGHLGAVYLALRFLVDDIEKQHPEVKGLWE